ncbi:HalOD1 output domain-containing protein [Halorubellus salinus]|uniref:HalOD1 output domain-containing protein n=1 Tax=Halorubellus salinus TaxID=755309 RepID=UPI001D068605|nr:HalOD1 output domain-containing protein [Halorubellus salinus]
MASSSADRIVHRELDVDGREPATQIAEHVASLSECEVESLESTWDTFGHVIDTIFEDPPSADAHVQVTVTYEGYRITIEQNGHAKFVPVNADSR